MTTSSCWVGGYISSPATILAPKKRGATLGPRQIEVGPVKTVFERKRVSSKKFATKLKKKAYCNMTHYIHLLLIFTTAYNKMAK